MPYYLFKAYPEKRFELIESFPAYRDARNRARSLRADLEVESGYAVKIMFAKDAELAERLLQEEREPRPLGEDA